MLAKRVAELPTGEGWIFEPKWDGFRALVFRDGDELFIQSRDEKPLDRYFPEVVAALKAQLPPRCVLDGEIVIARDGGLDFEALQMRLHPAASRVKLLSQQIPASVVFFDLLCEGDRDLRAAPYRERRAALEALLGGLAPPLHLTPATKDRAVASDWFRRFEGAGLDGVMAKPGPGVYEPNKRVMLKVKHERDCDCVVAGFRWHKDSQGTAVGSLLLGLYDDAGNLQHVGVCASFTDAEAPRAGRVPRALPRAGPDRSPVEGVGRVRGERRGRAAPPGRDEPLEPGQGSVVGAAAPRAGGRGRLRPHARQPLPPHGPVPPLAHRQAAGRLHLRPARGGPAARAGDDLREGLTIRCASARQRDGSARCNPGRA